MCFHPEQQHAYTKHTTIQMYIIYKGRERKGVVGLREKEEARWEREMNLVLAC